MKWWGYPSLAVGLACCAYGAFSWPRPVAFVLGFAYGALLATLFWSVRARDLRDEVVQEVARDAMAEIERRTTERAMNN